MHTPDRDAPPTPLQSVALWCRRAMLAGILAALVFQALFYAAFLTRRIGREGENCLAECRRAERALEVAHGRPLFTDMFTWPHNGISHGPLMFYPVGYALRAAGLPEGRWEQAQRAYVAGRCVALAGAVALLVWLACMAAHVGLTGWWRLVPCLLFFSARPVFKFADSYRPDLPMMALALWGWFVALRGRTWRSAVAAAALGVVAFCYKPTALTSAAILGLWLLLARDFRRAIWFGLSYSVGLAGVFLWIRLATAGSGSAFDAQVLDADIFWPATYEMLAFLGRTPSQLIPFLGGALAWALLARSNPGREPDCSEDGGVPANSPTIRPLLVAFALSFVASELIVLRPGSDIYYYLEPYCWGCVLTAVCARRGVESLSSLSWRLRPRSAAVWALLFCMVFLAYAQRTRRLWSERAELERIEAWAERNPALAEILSNTHGEILLDEGYPYWFTHSPPTMLFAVGYSVLVSKGGISTEPLIAKIAAHDFERVILTYDASREPMRFNNIDLLPRPVNAAIVRHYELEDYLNPYYVYHPRTAGWKPAPQ